MPQNLRVVLAAFLAEVVLAGTKLVAFLLTASPAMLAETYHSLADSVNHLLLMFGIRYSDREADDDHPFGYGKAQFFYNFLVAILLFTFAGVATIRNSVAELRGTADGGGVAASLAARVDPVLPVDPVYAAVAVLLVAIVVEGLALREALRETHRQMDEHGWESYREAFASTSDTITQTAMFEETLGITGASLALVGIVVGHLTGDPRFDAAAALLIGLLMVGFAGAIAYRTKRLLLGEGLSEQSKDALADCIAEGEDIDGVDYLRTAYVGPKEVLVTGDVQLADDLDADGVATAVERAEARCHEIDERVEKVYLEPAA